MFENIPKQKFFAIFASVGVLLIVILGFSALGSPVEREAKELDRKKSAALKIAVGQIENYARKNQTLPDSLVGVGGDYYYNSMKDPETSEYFHYEKKSNTDYAICTNFGAEYQPDERVVNNSKYGRSLFDIFDVAYDGAPEIIRHVDKEWYYEPGFWCFERSVEGVISPGALVPQVPSSYSSSVEVLEVPFLEAGF